MWGQKIYVFGVYIYAQNVRYDIFLLLLFFFSIQIAYGTTKQNLVKSKYTQVIT